MWKSAYRWMVEEFADADLLGMPLRVTVSPRTLEKDSVELKRRSESDTALVPLAEAAERVREAVGSSPDASRNVDT